MTSAGFWEQQQFSYIITYSFNRGPKLEALQVACDVESQRIRQQLLIVPPDQLPGLRERLRYLERTNDLDLLPLTDGPAAFHITASPVAVIKQHSYLSKQLATVLHLPIVAQMDWMCAPVYRDALAFYNEQHQLVCVLNICFACDRMMADDKTEIQADALAYQRLRVLLVQLGHPTAEADATEQEHLRQKRSRPR